MKNKKLRVILLVLIISLSSIFMYSQNIIFWFIALATFITYVIIEIILVFKQVKTRSFYLGFLVKLLLISVLGFYTIKFSKDIAILKGATERGKNKTINPNENEIKRYGGKFNYAQYIAQLKQAAKKFVVESDSLKYENNYYEYLTITYEPKNYSKKILITASIHGDEQAGALSIPIVLNDIVENPQLYQNTAICIVSPMNPIGLAYTSRVNENGCNINRDFNFQSQPETKKLVGLIEKFKPDLIFDMHENHGEQKTYLSANRMISDGFAKTVSNQLSEKNIELESEMDGFDGGGKLKINGWQLQSMYEAFIKKIADYGDMRGYGNSNNLNIIALECDQSLPLEKRTSICVNAIKISINNINKLN